MDRHLLEDLSFEELQAEARRYNLVPLSSRSDVIDQIMSHLERNGLLNDLRRIQSKDLQSSENQICSLMFEQMRQQQQDFMMQLMLVLNFGRNGNQGTTGQTNFLQNVPTRSPGDSDSVRNMVTSNTSTTQPVNLLGVSDRSRSAILSTVPTAQTISLLASQIPNFSGSEDENVEIWIQKVERVSRIHGVSEDVTLLAASTKLIKLARDWFQLGTGSLNISWTNFREAIVRRFRRSVPFHVAVQKVEARKWNFAKESFQEYAMSKVKLMQNLNIPENDSIHFLINGIGNMALRGIAALRVNLIDKFLEEMHRVTVTCGDSLKKSSFPTGKLDQEKSRSSNNSSSEDQFVRKI